jgi:hypothetical protein
MSLTTYLAQLDGDILQYKTQSYDLWHSYWSNKGCVLLVSLLQHTGLPTSIDNKKHAIVSFDETFGPIQWTLPEIEQLICALDVYEGVGMSLAKIEGLVELKVGYEHSVLRILTIGKCRQG